MYNKPKDTLEALQDLQRMKQQATLHPEKRDKGRHYLGPACYGLSKEEKRTMFECLNSIKVPSSYSSNIKRLLNMKEKKFAHVKFHGCHVLMMQLLSVALRGIPPDNVRATIIKLCAFLNVISQKAIDPMSLIKLHENVIVGVSYAQSNVNSTNAQNHYCSTSPLHLEVFPGIVIFLREALW